MDKSRQSGFAFSINAIFHSRFQALILFSLMMADRMSS